MGVNAEADGVCPWCGLRAHPVQLVQHTWRHTVKRAPSRWDAAGLAAMTTASLALIVYALISVIIG